MQLVWEGNWLVPNGHATICRNMTRALRKFGVDVKLRTTEMPPVERYTPFLDRDLLEMVCRPYRPANQRIRVVHRAPTDFCREDDRLTIGMTYSETTMIPQDWARKCNSEVDILVLASNQSAETFRKAGVKSSVWVIPQGVNVETFYPRKPAARDPLDLPSFRFLSVFEWAPRKGYDVLLQAFWQEFNKREDVCLVIKSLSHGSADEQSAVSQIKALKNEHAHSRSAPVYVFDGKLPERTLARLYQHCHAFVLPTRGEGIGLPLLEAAACGLPLIVTGWGGQMEFIHPKHAYLIDYSLHNVPASVQSSWKSLSGSWAEPDVASLRKQMRRVFEHRTKAMERAQLERKHVIDHWSWQVCASRFAKHVSRTIGEPIC